METTQAAEPIPDANGGVQDVVGDTLAGKAKELGCKVLQLCADTGNTTRATMAANPFTALAVAAAAGFVLGAFWRKKLADPGERTN